MVFLVALLELDRAPNTWCALSRVLLYECMKATLVLSSEVTCSLEEGGKFLRRNALSWPSKKTDKP